MKMHIFLKMNYYLKGHPSSYKTTFMPNLYSTFVYKTILIKICLNANIIETHFSIKLYMYDLKSCFYFMVKFCDFLL